MSHCITHNLSSPTSDVADCGNNPLTLEVLVCFRIHHQQPGLVSPSLYECHHFCMPHSLNVHTVYLEEGYSWVYLNGFAVCYRCSCSVSTLHTVITTAYNISCVTFYIHNSCHLGCLTMTAM